MASASSAGSDGSAWRAITGSRRRGTMRNSRSSTRPRPSVFSRLFRMCGVRANNWSCQVWSSTSTTRRVRTSFAGRVCAAIFLPTASGHAAQHSCSGVITSPDSLSPRMSLLARSMVGRILILSRRANPGTGAKNPTPLCPGGHWNWSAFYAIAELFEFPDHPRRAGALGLGTYRRTPFLVAHPLVQNQPEQSAESMGDGPDGLLVSQTRQQPAERQLEYAPFGLDRRLSRLIQQSPHMAVPLRRTRAMRLPCALVAARTHPHPRGQRLSHLECRCFRTHFGDHLHRRIQPETGHFRHALYRVLMLLHEVHGFLFHFLDVRLHQCQLLQR